MLDKLFFTLNFQRGGPGDSIGISQAGFQFLLMDRPTQIMRFILHYFDYLKVFLFSTVLIISP